MLKTKYLLPSILILFLSFILIGNCVDWLSEYDQRIKLTIDNTKIDSNRGILRDIYNPLYDDTDLANGLGWVVVYYEAELTPKWYCFYSEQPTPTNVYLATSSDGINWTEHGSSPVLSISGTEWRKDRLECHTILKHNSTYYMYAGGYNAADFEWDVGLFTSNNLIDWTPEGTNPILSAGVNDIQCADPCVIEISSGNWKMYYTGTVGGHWKICHATSADGVSWSKYDDGNAIISPTAGTWYSEHVGSTGIRKNGDRLELSVQGSSNNRSCSGILDSNLTGISFSEPSDIINPLLGPGKTGAFDEDLSAFDDFEVVDGKVLIYCEGIKDGYGKLGRVELVSGLPDFPVTVLFTPAQGEEIFTEFDADTDYMKCAFTSSDGITQLYAENETFNIAKSHYPPAQSDLHVKATTKNGTSYWPYFATDPAKSLTGTYAGTSWISAAANPTNQRFHIDLGSPKIINRIYYENLHNSGAETDVGVQNFTFWGSNSASSFAELTYATDTGWTQITTLPTAFDEHTASDAVDPKYITVTNSTDYQYYAFKFADNHGNGSIMGVRRIEIQTRRAVYHVKVPSISSSVDTDIYYYYDNDHADNTTYIGAINTTAATKAWDEWFSIVVHGVDDTTSSVLDSTFNSNDGTKKAANEPIVSLSSKTGDAQIFDGSDDFIGLGTSASLNQAGTLTLECVAKLNSDYTSAQYLMGNYLDNDPGADDSNWGFVFGVTDKRYTFLQNSATWGMTSDTDVDDDDWHYVVFTRTGSAGDWDLAFYLDSVADGTEDSVAANPDGGTYPTSMGRAGDLDAAYYNGTMDETRLSSSLRSAAWTKGTYNSLWDTLFTYGSEETPIVTNVMFMFSDF